MRRFSRLTSLAVMSVAIVAIALPMAVFAHGGGNRLSAEPWVYVGKANECDTLYPAGSRIVTSAWLGGMGLPDDGTSMNTPGPVTGASLAAASRRDAHLGLLLSKNGPTGDCSAAGATINGVKNLVVDADFHLGFDYRDGGHCGAGAPRFNVTVKPAASSTPETFHFVGGCANGTPTDAPQDPAEWTRVRIAVTNAAQSFPAIPVGSRIVSIELIFDEGTDTANNDTQGVGLAVVDNIDINGRLITSGSGIEPGSGGRDDDDHGGHGHHGHDGRDD